MITFRHFLLSSAALVGALALSACSNPLGTHQPHFTGKLSGNQEVPATPSTGVGVGVLGACRTWNVESENRPQRGQFLPDLQAHSPAMGQKDGEKWTAAVDLQPTLSKSDRLLDASLDKTTNVLKWTISYSGLTGPVTGGHFHGPAGPGENAGVAVPFSGPLSSAIEGQATLTPAQINDLIAGRWYVNLHTTAYPAGEIRGQVSPRR